MTKPSEPDGAQRPAANEKPAEDNCCAPKQQETHAEDDRCAPKQQEKQRRDPSQPTAVFGRCARLREKESAAGACAVLSPAVWAALAALPLVLGLCFDLSAHAMLLGRVVILLLAALGVAALILAAQKRLTAETALLLLIAAGFLLRLAYIAATAVSERQHDVLDFAGASGHAGYILFFCDNGLSLPGFDPRALWSYYNPPLWHFLAGMWLRLNRSLGLSFWAACENIQCLSMACSALCMPASIRIFRELGLRGRGLCAAAAIVCLHPTFYLLAGSVNNDVLCLLLQLLALGAALAWFRAPTWPRILGAGAFVGLSMMAKTSGVLIAPAMALLFLVKFVQACREKRGIGRLLGQFAAFGAVSLPLGLWWSLRCLLRFGMPLGYVPSIGGAENPQYVGGYSVWQRLFSPQLSSPFETIGGPNTGYNIPSSLFKSSLFGEYTFAAPGSEMYAASWVLLAVNLLLAAAALAAMVWCLLHAFRAREKDRAPLAALALGWAVPLGMYVKFCFDYPHTCTMNFRYIVTTCVFGAAFLGRALAGRKARSRAGWLLTGGAALFASLGACLYSALLGQSGLWSLAAMAGVGLLVLASGASVDPAPRIE